mmetsp:Transcript_42911/g.86035  ORF Transcript_42911/g.86035 Transcript_42911/m.86035 type:complete len:154 (-) Transcript_42911:797-1258(-)
MQSYTETITATRHISGSRGQTVAGFNRLATSRAHVYSPLMVERRHTSSPPAEIRGTSLALARSSLLRAHHSVRARESDALRGLTLLSPLHVTISRPSAWSNFEAGSDNAPPSISARETKVGQPCPARQPCSLARPPLSSRARMWPWRPTMASE